MSLRPGDALVVDQRVVDGRRVWLPSPADSIETPWFGSLRRCARGKRHDMDAVRIGLDASVLLRLLLGEPVGQAATADPGSVRLSAGVAGCGS